MSNKKKILLDGIKKLLALKVPDEEIISNLRDVGIGEKQARALIDEVRLGKQQKEELPEEEGSEFEPEEKKFESSESPGEETVSEEDAQAEALEKNYPEEEKTAGISEEETVGETENLAEAETQDISEKEIENNGFEENAEETIEGAETGTSEAEEESREIQEGIEEGPTEAPEEEKEGTGFLETKLVGKKKFSKEKKSVKEENVDNADFEKLWEKGILTIVNQRLKEMKSIQEGIESELSKRASEIAKKEIDKVNVLFDSQSELAVETMNAKLGQRTKELDKMLDAKVLELKEISKSVKGDIARLEKLQQAKRDGLEQITERLEGLDEAKKTLIAEMNSDLIKSKSEIEEFLASSVKKVREIEARVNETLELESNIVDSLVKETEAKLAASQTGRENASAKKFEEALDALGIAKAGFEQQAREKLLEIDRQLKLLKKQAVPK